MIWHHSTSLQRTSAFSLYPFFTSACIFLWNCVNMGMIAASFLWACILCYHFVTITHKIHTTLSNSTAALSYVDLIKVNRLWCSFPYLDESWLDVFIIHKLWEDEEFFPEKLICEVDSSIHDTCTVSTDGVGNVTDVDCV